MASLPHYQSTRQTSRPCTPEANGCVSSSALTRRRTLRCQPRGKFFSRISLKVPPSFLDFEPRAYNLSFRCRSSRCPCNTACRTTAPSFSEKKIR
jgi:hypothetical protein